jgi:cytochrome oxidase assembly protein ShyY1
MKWKFNGLMWSLISIVWFCLAVMDGKKGDTVAVVVDVGLGAISVLLSWWSYQRWHESTSIPPDLEEVLNRPFVPPNQVEDEDEMARLVSSLAYNTGKVVTARYDEEGKLHVTIHEDEEGEELE